MSVPSAESIAKGYDQPRESDVGQFQLRLCRSHPARELMPALAAAFAHSKRAYGRAAILSQLLPFARLSPLIVDLAIRALRDRSYLVREHGCMVLAYAQAQTALPSLREATTHTDLRTQADARAAIYAIESGNHNLYVDRQATGGTFWQVPHVPGL
jgi:hypothetical protein